MSTIIWIHEKHAVGHINKFSNSFRIVYQDFFVGRAECLRFFSFGFVFDGLDNYHIQKQLSIYSQFT